MQETIFPKLPVLLVDDEDQFLFSAEFTLNSMGITNTKTLSDSRKLMSFLSEEGASVIMLDMNMPYIKGWDLLPLIVSDHPDIPVIILTALNEVDMAVDCMKTGAFDYLVKPVDDTRLVTIIKQAIELGSVRDENRRLKKYLLTDALEYPEVFRNIITRSAAMRSIFQYIEAVAPSPLPILVTGETGVGKELIAQAIHKISNRSGKFVPVNVAGVDDHLFSDTLFGHKKGSFTGADRERRGLIEEAAGGTLFLDEIGDLNFESQVKLLRLLQEGKFHPIGSDVPKNSDARIILATNADLEAIQKNGHFRKDLYYRIQAHRIHIPELRKRKDDIALLLDHFFDKAAKMLNKKRPTPPKELVTLLSNYSFPGNIRELEGMVFDAVSIHKSGILSMESFKTKIAPELSAQIPAGSGGDELKEISSQQIVFPEQFPSLKAIERMLIDEALKRANGNQSIAAELLGLTRRALNNRLNRSSK